MNLLLLLFERFESYSKGMKVCFDAALRITTNMPILFSKMVRFLD